MEVSAVESGGQDLIDAILNAIMRWSGTMIILSIYRHIQKIKKDKI